MNNATRAEFPGDALWNPFASGSFRWVARESTLKAIELDLRVYANGQDWRRDGAHFYDTDLITVKEALFLITKWNSNHFIDKMIRLNQPEVLDLYSRLPCDIAGRKVLQEPFIENYQKFNSNTGWADDSLPWPRVMQALSHFTYHITNGQMVLCDLQGGFYSDGVVLTDPVIMSNARTYGQRILGATGSVLSLPIISATNFVGRSGYVLVMPFQFIQGTTMEHVSTVRSRPRMTLGNISEY